MKARAKQTHPYDHANELYEADIESDQPSSHQAPDESRVGSSKNTADMNIKSANSPAISNKNSAESGSRGRHRGKRSSEVNSADSDPVIIESRIAEAVYTDAEKAHNQSLVTSGDADDEANKGELTASSQMEKALAKSDPETRSNRIGELLVELGQLTPKEVRQVLRRQRSGEFEPFGRIALQMGLSSNRDIKRALAIQSQRSGPLNPQSCWENSEIVALNNRHSASAEAIRTLRSRLMLDTSEETTRPIAIVSPDHEEGRSYVCANLAVAYAQAGRRTLLIDADLRRPSQHEIFGINNEQGFSTLVANHDEDHEEHPVFNIIDNLYLVPAGPPTSSPQELLCRDYTGDWLDVVMDFFDVVLVDTPPASRYADAELLAAWSGQAIMVARKHVSQRSAIDKLVKQMKANNTNVRGLVINDR